MSTAVETAFTLLRNVVDPELGLNIIDLGLIYDLQVESGQARVLMTFTTIGCPISGALVQEVHEALQPLGLREVTVEVTYTPPWTAKRLSPAGRAQLGIGG